MPFKRLEKGNAAAVVADKSEVKAGELWKDAILVHEGEFDSQDGPIKFDEARLKRVAKNMNAEFNDLEKEYGGAEKTPMGAYPPLLDSHTDDSNGRMLGRLRGPFRVEKRDVPKVGKDIACLISKLVFLGAAAHEAVQDGRIYHLSIGVNEETEILGELSAVIEPAAPGAMLLAKGKKSDTPLVPPSPMPNNKMRGNSMPKSLQKRLAANKARVATIKGLLGDTQKLTKLAGETKSSSVRLIAESKVRMRLSALMKSAKLTPAGFKKLDVKRLAAMDADALEMCMSALEANEPVIEPGQRGSKGAIDAVELRRAAGDDNFKRLKNEARDDINRMLGKKNSKRLAAGEEEPEKKMGVDEKVDKKMGDGKEAEPDKKRMAEYAKCLSELSASIEGGDKDMAKKHLASLGAFGEQGAQMGIGDPAPDVAEQEKAQIGIQEQIDALNVNLSKVVDCLKHLLVAEEDEGSEMEAEMGADPAEGAPAAGDEDEGEGDKKPPVKKEEAPDKK